MILTLTLKQVLAAEGWTFDHPYCLYVARDGETIFSVRCMSTARQYCKLAALSGAIPADEWARIKAVKADSRAEGANVDADHKQEGSGPYILERKQRATPLSWEEFKRLMHTTTGHTAYRDHNEILAERDTLLVCLLGEHGLRVGEVVALNKLKRTGFDASLNLEEHGMDHNLKNATTSLVQEQRLEQAWQQVLDQQQAAALCSRLLRELDAYLERRQRRHYHSEFDDLLDGLLPGLALAIHLLAPSGAAAEQAETKERWGALYPETQALLGRLAAALGPQYADHMAAALSREIQLELERRANERTHLMLTIMDWGASNQHPRFRGDTFDIEVGLEAWSAFCGEASLDQLREAGQRISLREQAAQGRQKLARLSQAQEHLLPKGGEIPEEQM